MDCGREWRDDRATDALRTWILRTLGCNVVGVELENEQLDVAIRDAQEYWMGAVGRTRTVDLTLTSAREYPDTAIGNDVDSVVDVYFDSQGDSLKGLYGWADVEVNPFEHVFDSRMGFSGINQYLMYREDAQEIVSSDRDWAWDRSRRVLIVSPYYAQIREVKVVYLSRCFDYNYLSTYEWLLFKEYALVKAMYMLATIRMKFPEKPSATGTYSMDGETMWANAEAREMRIEEKIQKLRRPMGPIT